ncbi:helix-turn-helix domain-containing protein [Parasphingorhabdus sp.]|uniref:winged helix-turn-helix transcriptional regulator n=1 Tax=Parasphingorhabdus sp. TaxID=2709688 RepID=UPI00309EE6E8
MKHETIRACSIWRALEIVGDVPVLLIMERAFLGTNTFEAFVDETGVPRSVVSGRLKKLVDEDCLVKKPEPKGRRRFYRLTEKGRDLFPVALAMLGWQHRWESGERGFTVQLVHKTCEHVAEPRATCQSCTGGIDPRDVDWKAGPGLAQVVPDYSTRRRPSKAVTARRDKGTLVDTVISLYGDRWSTLIVRAMFSGFHRFDRIQADTQMAPNILSGRITDLIDRGILHASQYCDLPPRYEYRLTEKGRALYPVILSLLQWGDCYYADKKGPPLLLAHRPCHSPLEMVMACDHCDEPLRIDEVTFKTT